MDKKQEEARQQILDLVADYCENYHIKNKKEFEPGSISESDIARLSIPVPLRT